MQALTDTQLRTDISHVVNETVLNFDSSNPSFVCFNLLGHNTYGKHTKAMNKLIKAGYKAKLSLCKDFIIIHK